MESKLLIPGAMPAWLLQSHLRDTKTPSKGFWKRYESFVKKITAYFEVGLVTTPAWQVPLEGHLQAKCEAHDEIMRSSVSHGTLCRIILDCLRLAVSKEVRLAHNDRKANHSKKQFSHRSGHYIIFFVLPFLYKNKANQWTHFEEKTLSFFQQLPRLCLKPWRAFWANMVPFKGPQPCLGHCFLELQR